MKDKEWVQSMDGNKGEQNEYMTIQRFKWFLGKITCLGDLQHNAVQSYIPFLGIVLGPLSCHDGAVQK